MTRLHLNNVRKCTDVLQRPGWVMFSEHESLMYSHLFIFFSYFISCARVIFHIFGSVHCDTQLGQNPDSSPAGDHHCPRVPRLFSRDRFLLATLRFTR